MLNFDEVFEESTRIHGHICAGQVLGVRMSLLALSLLNIYDPKGQDRKKIYVIVEIDRCATDAIQSVTGCTLGKRSMKWIDNGIMAATYINLETGRAVRIVALEEARESSKKYCTEIGDKYARQLEAYKLMPDSELFKVSDVKVSIPPEDLPGRPLRRVQCTTCGEWVQDSREIEKDGTVFCKNCANGPYFEYVNEVV